MFKGLVVKLTNQYGVVLTEDNQYLKIQRKDGLAVGQRIFFFEEDLQAPVKGEESLPRAAVRWQRVLSSVVLAASLLFFFIFGNLLWPSDSQAYYAVISVDINPSLELTINRERIVVKVEALNQEGYQVGGQDLVGQKIEAALESIVEKAARYNYLAEQDTVLLAATINPKKEPKNDNSEQDNIQVLINELMQADLPEEYSYVYLSAEQEEYSKAKENNLSLGKYEVMVLSEQQIKPEEIKNMKVKELLEEIDVKAELSENKPNERVWFEDSYQQVKKEPNKQDNNLKDDKGKKDQDNASQDNASQNNANQNKSNQNKANQNNKDKNGEDKSKEVFQNEQQQSDIEKRSENANNKDDQKNDRNKNETPVQKDRRI